MTTETTQTAPGRRVTIGDLVRVHPGRPERCLCRGTGEVTLHVAGNPAVPVLVRPCAVALAAFRERHALDVIDTSEGARWRAGREPETASA